MENIKWKAIELEDTPIYHDGVVIIKEDTEIESPLAIVPFPLGRHRNGTRLQRERAKLIAAAPELFETLQKLVELFNSDLQGICSIEKEAVTKARDIINRIKGVQNIKNMGSKSDKLAAIVEKVNNTDTKFIDKSIILASGLWLLARGTKWEDDARQIIIACAPAFFGMK